MRPSRELLADAHVCEAQPLPQLLHLALCIGSLITDFIKEDSPLCLTRAISRTMIGPCYHPPLSLGSGSECRVQGSGVRGGAAYRDYERLAHVSRREERHAQIHLPGDTPGLGIRSGTHRIFFVY